MRNKNWIALPDAAPSDDYGGALCYWDPPTHGLLVLDCLRAFERAGVPEHLIPTTPTPSIALGLAARASLPRDCRLFTRQGIIAFVDASKTDADISELDNWSFGVRAAVYFDPERKRLMFHRDTTRDLVLAIRNNFAHARSTFSGHLVSRGLVGVLTSYCAGIRLRPHGGVYFVPRGDYLDRWRRLTDEVGALGVEFSEIAVAESEKSVEAIIGALTFEAQSTLAQISKDLKTGLSQERAFDRRLEQCGELLDKVHRYEDALGQAMGEVSSLIQKTQRTLVHARLSVDD